MQRIVTQNDRMNGNFPVVPFRLDIDAESKPTTFQVILVIDNIPYQYGFSVTRTTVDHEWLYAWPNGRIQVWLERDETSNDWKIGEKLKGQKRVWRDATRNDALFLSTAVALISEDLKPIYDWFSVNLDVFSNGDTSPYLSKESKLGEGIGCLIRYLKTFTKEKD